MVRLSWLVAALVVLGACDNNFQTVSIVVDLRTLAVRSGDATGVDTLTGLSAGDNLPVSALGSATLVANRVAAGGFDTIGLMSGDAILFDGTVSLAAGRSISLTTAILGSTGATGSASVNAPFVTLAGTGTSVQAGLLYSAYQVAAWRPSVNASQSALTVNAANIDMSGFLFTGTGSAIVGGPCGGSVCPANIPDFATTTLSSAGDIRFVASASGTTFRLGRPRACLR